MTKQRRTFREAADLVLKQNYSFIEASRSLSAGESALRSWGEQMQLKLDINLIAFVQGGRTGLP